MEMKAAEAKKLGLLGVKIFAAGHDGKDGLLLKGAKKGMGVS